MPEGASAHAAGRTETDEKATGGGIHADTEYRGGREAQGDQEIPETPRPSAADVEEIAVTGGSTSQVQERGGQLNGLHRDEDNSDPRWRRRKKHIFIVSSAGKPIFTRHGDEDKLNPLFGVMCSLVSFMTQNDDVPRVVLAGNHKIVFLIRGPIYLISVSRTLEPTTHLARQLQFVYTQLVSILTRKGLEHVFKRKHGFDLRNLLGNSGEQVLSHLVGAMDGHKLASSLPLHTSMSFVLGAPWCARLPLPLRNQVNKALLSVKSQHLIYAVLLAKNQLVQFVRPRKTALWAEGRLPQRARRKFHSLALASEVASWVEAAEAIACRARGSCCP